MRQVIAIGGGGFGRTTKSSLIEQYILDQTGKEEPNICFIPTATGDLEEYIKNFYSVFSKLKCSASHISFFKRTIDLKKYIEDQDAIFVGGGNTKSMLAVWRDWGLDSILKDAYQRGVVMSGVSAGAICWFEKGLTDSWESELKLMECMNFIPGNCAPHYDEEPERRPATKKLLNDQSINFMYGIEGGAALHFIDEIPKQTIRFDKNKNAYKVNLDKNIINEIAFKIMELTK
jgi:dipeptidase E